MRASPDLTGRIIAGRYRIVGRIGEGGFAVVYRGVHLELGSEVAIKIISQVRPDLLARFRREARVQDRLHSRFIVRLRDFGREPDGLHYIVQDFVPGRSLSELVEYEGPLAPARAAEMSRQVCLALDEAHLHGIVHRDVKPANVMVVDTARGEEIRLLDFGIAKLLDEGSREAAITQTGQVFGTVAYMAPEQIRGLASTASTDLYGVGGLFYTLLTGAYPYRGSIESVAMQHLVAPLPRLPPASPPAAEAVVHRAMAKEPADRYASAKVMAAALEQLKATVAGWPALSADDDATLVQDGGQGGEPELLDSGFLESVLTHRRSLSSSHGNLLGELFGVRAATKALGISHRLLMGGVVGAAAVGVLLAFGWLALRSKSVDVPERIAIQNSGPAKTVAGISPVKMVAGMSPDSGIPHTPPLPGPVARPALPQVIVPPPSMPQPPQEGSVASGFRRGVSGRREPIGGDAPPTRPVRAAVAKPVAQELPEEAAPTPTKAMQLSRALTEFSAALDACNCTSARRFLDAVRALHAGAAESRESSYLERCDTRRVGRCRVLDGSD